jgi:TonB family protein
VHTANVQTIDQRDPMGKAFAGSVIMHGAAIGLLVTSGLWSTKDHWGSEHASTGSVGVTMVKTIPIPHREAPVNPLANDKKSIVPEEPLPVARPQKQVLAPLKDAIAIPDKIEKKKKPPKQEVKMNFRPPEAYKENQVYSHVPQAANTAMYGTQGAAGIDIGPASVLGSQFGAYVDLMRDRISQHWVTAAVQAPPSAKCLISFTIARNGMVTNVQVSKPSGNYLLDTSAKRAVLDSNPLPALPREFPQNEATVELGFQLKQ